MPLYEYLCPQGHVTEILAGVSDRHAWCETCHARAQRIISAPAPPVMGGMVYRPDPHKPLSTRAEVKVPLKDIQARDDRLRERFLRNAGKKVTPNPIQMVKP